MEAKEVLQRALDNLTPENWFQGALHNDDKSKQCVMGHIWEFVDVGHPVTSYLESFMQDRYGIPTMIENDSRMNVARFNDDPGTSLEDIQLFLKKAIEECE